MLRPFKRRFDPFDWTAAIPAERAAHALRALSAAAYLLLSLLAAMQLLSPGALQRIAAQDAGEVLLIALAGSLLLLGAVALGGVARGAPRPVARPGASDALLHFALAAAGLDLAVGHGLLSGAAGSIVIGGSGLALLGCGMGLFLSGALPGAAGDTQQKRHLNALQRRDQIVRGLVLGVLGVFLLEAAADSVPGNTVDLARTPWGMPLLAATGVALFAYGLHALWLLREESRLWRI